MFVKRHVVCGVLIFVSVCLQFGVVDAKWTISNTTDDCYKDRGKIFPCSSTITGNVVLVICYGALLGLAAKFISDGAEMLLDFGLPAGLIGGIVLPVLGAVPDCAIIVASGLGKDAQEKLAVGMGTLAGSTVMLLTIAWTASLFVGKCDLKPNGEAIDQQNKGPFSLHHQGVTVLPDARGGISLMLVTSLLYLIVQSADWHWGATLVGPQPAYVKKAALSNLVLCGIGFVAVILFSVLDSKRNERLERLHKEDLLKRKVLRAMFTMVSSPQTAGPTCSDPQAAPAEPTPVAKKYFKAWHVTTGSRDSKEKLGLLAEDYEAAGVSVDSPAVEPKTEKESKAKNVLKCAILLLGGVGLVTIFADPMCDVLTALTSKKSKSYIPIPLFYVSFVVTPFCSNASELVSSLIFASKKTKENATMTFSQLYGAATMNNTLCFGIFMALVYFRNLEWIYGAEVICILAAQWIVGLIGYATTYRLWMGIPVGLTYILCLVIVWALEYLAHWH